MMPTWELTNPRDLAYALARTHRMLEHLRGSDPTVARATAQLGLVFEDLRFDGLQLPDFVAIVFGLHAYVTSSSPSLLLQNPVTATVNCGQFLSETRLPPAVMDKFLANRSITRSGLRAKLTSRAAMSREEYTAQMSGPIFATDFRAFREHPLVDLADGNHMVLDLQFLTELLFSGLFFHLFFSLPSAQREEFSSLWGRIFELSVNELLDNYYPRSAGLLQMDVTFDEGFTRLSIRTMLPPSSQNFVLS